MNREEEGTWCKDALDFIFCACILFSSDRRRKVAGELNVQDVILFRPYIEHFFTLCSILCGTFLSL